MYEYVCVYVCMCFTKTKFKYTSPKILMTEFLSGIKVLVIEYHTVSYNWTSVIQLSAFMALIVVESIYLKK